MKIWLLAFCAGWLSTAVPCRAQQPASAPAPLMLVYVAKLGEDFAPRIALGLEKPTLKIGTFEKCVRVFAEWKVDPKLAAIAVQLKPDDAKALIAAIKALGAPDARELPNASLFCTTPDNKVLNGFGMSAESAVENLLKGGIIEFDPEAQSAIVGYLTETLHPQ